MLQRVAHTIRGLSADGVEQAKSGHPGMPLGAAEIASVLRRSHQARPRARRGLTGTGSSCLPVTGPCCSTRSCISQDTI